MSEKHKIGPDGLLDDGVRTDPVTPTDMLQYAQAQQALSRWTAPVLLHAGNPHERLIIINMDGTGNDVVHDPEHITNIGLLRNTLEIASKLNPHIHAIYEPGPGTQTHALGKALDGALGYTYDAHLEHAYSQLIEQAYKWRVEDPQAQIRVVVTGFSRGGDEAAGLTRLIHERGVQDPSGRTAQHRPLAPNLITYTKPPLVSPGKTLQAVMLFDPVGTGIPHRRDRQLPPSVVSGLQITARDERRDAFPSSEIIPNGLSADGRFLQVTVPGAHSDIGGSYHRDGLSTLNFNLAADYLNALSDTPLLRKQPLPEDPHLYAIHHSEDHQWFYATGYVAGHGERGLRGSQRDAPDCRATIACLPPEPLDPTLAAALPERQAVMPRLLPPAPRRDAFEQHLAQQRENHPHHQALGHIPANAKHADAPTQSHASPFAHPHSGIQQPANAVHEETGRTPENDLMQRLDRMLKAAEVGDWNSFRKDTQAFAEMPPGRELRANAKTMVDMQEHHARELAEQRQAMEQQMQQQMQRQHSQHRSHGLSR